MTAPATITPIVLTASQAGELVGLDGSTIRRNSEAGLFPKPIHIGSAVRWRRAEIEDWLAAGCPAAAEWAWPITEDESALRMRA